MKFAEIKSIKKLTEKEIVYDIETDEDHSFFGNGICLHNSFSPNLQNYPKQGEEGKNFRKVFIAPENYYFFEADYSGFQLRLMGIYSNDENMIEAFNTIQDLHSVTAQSIFSQDVTLEYFLEHKKEEPYKTARFNGKTTNLAFVFSQTPFSFQTKIREEWTEEQIDNYIKNNNLKIIVDSYSNQENKYLTIATNIHERFFIKYPKIKEYADNMIKFASENGYVDCPIFPGLRRHLPELLKEGKNLSKEKKSHYSNLKNMAVNAGAQGGEALIIYKSLKKIYDKINDLNLKSKLAFCVHDSEGGYIHKNEIRQMYSLLKENMEVFDYSIPILAEVEVGDVWGFGKEIDEKNIEDFINDIK